MKKLFLALACLAATLAFAATAAAEPLVAVTDPTPDGSFTGEYDTGEPDDPLTEEDESQRTGTQQGYVAVYEDGVVVCNGNPELTRPDDGSPLVGYVWVGPGQASSNPTASAPGGAFGAGNNHETADGTPTEDPADSPCPDADPSGVNE